jgi:L-lactate dehydrogenase complex protein LldG
VITEEFIRQATAAGAEIHLVDGSAGLVDRVTSLLGDAGAGDASSQFAVCVAASVEGVGPLAGLLATVPGVRFDVTRETASQALVGITAADWGVAQTGTLVCDSSPAAQRLASSLPVIHIALLPSGRIVPDMAAALSRIDPRNAPFIAAITGPSRTADIERVLTIGVHGPKRLVILIVQDGNAGDPRP